MVKVAIWCRHVVDNIIGIENKLPWHVPSDIEKFRRIIDGQNIVIGRHTYESLPNKDLPADKIFILTSKEKLEVADKTRHFIGDNIRMFKDFEEDLYICGGAKVYDEFILSKSRLMPEIIVDCVYHGEIDSNLKGKKIDITKSVETMNKEYRKISSDYEKDNVTTTIYIKKGEFVDQMILRSLLHDIEA